MVAVAEALAVGFAEVVAFAVVVDLAEAVDLTVGFADAFELTLEVGVGVGFLVAA